MADLDHRPNAGRIRAVLADCLALAALCAIGFAFYVLSLAANFTPNGP